MKVISLNTHELATVLDALCLFKNIYEGKDADCKRTAYMEHFGCDCGEPLVKTKEIDELYEYIAQPPDNAGECQRALNKLATENGRLAVELVTAMSTILRLETENHRFIEVVKFWQDKAIKLTQPSAILALDKPPKE